MESNGLLLWLKRGKNPQGNFVAVAINNGFPELNMKLGRHIPLLTIRSQVRFKYCVLPLNLTLISTLHLKFAFT